MALLPEASCIKTGRSEPSYRLIGFILTNRTQGHVIARRTPHISGTPHTRTSEDSSHKLEELPPEELTQAQTIAGPAFQGTPPIPKRRVGSSSSSATAAILTAADLAELMNRNPQQSTQPLPLTRWSMKGFWSGSIPRSRTGPIKPTPRNHECHYEQPPEQLPSPMKIREELERMVLNDLLGPVGGPEEEIDEQSVRDRYLVGMLAPKRQELSPEQFDELPQGGGGSVEDGAAESSSPQRRRCSRRRSE